MSADEGCPICNTSSSAKESFAVGTVAEPSKEKAPGDESHREWIERHTDDGTVTEIRVALEAGEDAPR